MTRAEIIPLIKRLLALYPNHGVTDVKSLVEGWEMMFGEDEAEYVYKAARLHISTNKWFPKASEIKELIPIAANMYKAAPTTAIEAKTVFDDDWNEGCEICPYNDQCLKVNCIV